MSIILTFNEKKDNIINIVLLLIIGHHFSGLTEKEQFAKGGSMSGTFNTSDFDEEEKEDGFGDDTGDGFGDDTGDGFGDDVIYGDDTDTTTEEEAREFEQEYTSLKQNDQKKRWVVRKNGKLKYNPAHAKGSALRKSMAPKPEGICPVCHKRSIFKSWRPMDIALFTGLVMLVTAGSSRVSTFYCMNRKCKVSYWKNYCFRCGGDRWIGGKVPWKRIAGVDM